MSLRKVVDIIRLYVISPEVLIIVCLIFLGFMYPRIFPAVGQEVTREDSLLRYIAAVPLALLAVTFHLTEKTLRPSETPRNKVLYEWPDYWRLKYRSLGAILWCATASAGSLGVCVFKTRMSLSIIGEALLAAILIALTATLTQFLAYLRVREILESRLQ